MTEKANKLYKAVDSIFEEHGDGSCELDTLDNYYDFLKSCDDDFLDFFDITYNTTLEEDWEDDEFNDFHGPTYEDPSVILTPKKKYSFGRIFITCRGYETCCGFYLPCEVNANNSEQGKRLVTWLKEQMKID